MASSPGDRLRTDLQRREIIPLVAAYDVFSASIAARYFDGILISGFSFPASYYGLPDVGRTAWSEIAAFVQRVRSILPAHHVVVDVDDGYADAQAACHAVKQLEALGTTGVVLQDQQRSRKYGHPDGEQIIKLDSFVDTLRRVLDARKELFVVARTAATDPDEAVRRAHSFAAAGADAVLLEGVRDLGLLRSLRDQVECHLVFNQIAGGTSPPATLNQLSSAGVSLVYYSTPRMFAAHDADDAAMSALTRGDGRLPATRPADVDVTRCTRRLSQKSAGVRSDNRNAIRACQSDRSAAPRQRRFRLDCVRSAPKPGIAECQQMDLAERLNKLSPEKRALLELMSGRTRRYGYQLVAQALLANGVTHVYAVSGVPVQQLLGAAVEAGMRVIGTRHQQAAVLMATAHNYIAGRIDAVVVVSAGPAVTNVATGLLVASDNAWPVIVLGGRRQGIVEGQDSFQELDAAQLYRPITKWASCVAETSDISGNINRAFEVAVTGRPGPVYLDITENVLCTQSTSNHVYPSGTPGANVAGDKDDIERAAELLRNARRPACILGKGARWSLAPDDIAGLLEQHYIAFISSPMGRGILPEEHSLCFNHAKQELQATADVVLVLGARLNWTFRFGSQINPHAKIIQVDIDPDEVKKHSRTSLGIIADTGNFVAALRAAMHASAAAEPITDRALWHTSLAVARERRRAAVDERASSDRLPMSVYRLMKELKESLPADTILIADGNISMMAVQHVIPARTPFSRLTAGSNGCMGVGVPFGIGARLGNPSRPVVVISGDMAFGISAMELETAVRCDAPVIVVVANNEGLSGGCMERELFPAGHERVTMYEPGIRYEKIAEAFGAHWEYVDHPEQLRAAFDRALASGKPACINVKVDPYESFMSEL